MRRGTLSVASRVGAGRGAELLLNSLMAEKVLAAPLAMAGKGASGEGLQGVGQMISSKKPISRHKASEKMDSRFKKVASLRMAET